MEVSQIVLQMKCLIVVKDTGNRNELEKYARLGSLLVTINSQLYQSEFIFIYTIQRSYNEI